VISCNESPCPTGFECFSELELGVCVDLSDSEHHPGPCSSSQWQLGAADLADGEIPFGVGVESCSYEYVDNVVSHIRCSEMPEYAEDALANCTFDYDPNRPLCHDTGDDGRFTSERYGYANGQLIAVNWEEDEGPGGETCGRSTLDGDQVRIESCLDTFSCVVVGPVQCDFGAEPVVSTKPGPLTVREFLPKESADARWLYDAGNNLRYIVHRMDPSSGVRLQVTEFDYACWN
jgi:hypothetical protein